MTTVWKPRSVRYELSMNGKLTLLWLTRYGSQNLVDMLGCIPSTIYIYLAITQTTTTLIYLFIFSVPVICSLFFIVLLIKICHSELKSMTAHTENITFFSMIIISIIFFYLLLS